MKLAIISDTHDNLTNLEKFLAYAAKEKIETVIHCGDITNAETLTKLAEGFARPIYFVYGNVANSRGDLAAAARNFSHVFNCEDSGEAKLGGKLIAFCHKPEEAQALVQKKDYNFVFYGHTHRPWVERVGDTLIVNPGTLAGMFMEATFAVFDSSAGSLDLKTLAKLSI